VVHTGHVTIGAGMSTMRSLRGHLLRHAGVLLFYTALTILFTYPLAFHLRDSVLGGKGDNLYFAWLTGWYEHAIFGGGGHPFFSEWMNFPAGWNLSTTDTALAAVLPGSFFSQFFGPIAGYNLAMMLTFILSGWAMYIWIRHITRSEAAGLLAGTIFAFLPFHMAKLLIGHLNLATTQWFPFFFMGLTGILRLEAKGWWQPAILAAVSLGLIGFTTMYYLYMCLIISAVFVLVYLVFGGYRVLKTGAFWKQIGLFTIVALPLLFLSIRYFFNLAESGTIVSRDWEYVSLYSASPTDFILPSTDHFLVGRWIGSHFNRDLWPEATLYIGLIALVLLVVAIWKRKASHQVPLVWAGLAAASAAFILALGTDLHWNAQSVILKVPVFLQDLVGKSETRIFLPTYWLFHHLPFFDRMRAIARFGFFTDIFTTMLAGIGAAVVINGIKTNWRRWVTVGLIALVVFEFYPGPYTGQLTKIEPRPLDTWLAAQPGNGAVAMFPFSQVQDQFNVFANLIYKKPFIGGLFNAYQPVQFQEIQPVMEQFPARDTLDLLRQLGITYTVVTKAGFQDMSTVEADLKAGGMIQLTDLGDVQVWGFKN